jgi:hypothetical protein
MNTIATIVEMSHSRMNRDQRSYYLVARTILIGTAIAAIGILCSVFGNEKSRHWFAFFILAGYVGTFIITQVWLRFLWVRIPAKSFVRTPTSDVFETFYEDTWVSWAEMRLLVPNEGYELKSFASETVTYWNEIELDMKMFSYEVLVERVESPQALLCSVAYGLKLWPRDTYGSSIGKSVFFEDIISDLCQKFEAKHLEQLRVFNNQGDIYQQKQFRSLFSAFVRETCGSFEFMRIPDEHAVLFNLEAKQ